MQGEEIVGVELNNKSIRVSKKSKINECLFGVNFRKNLPENLIINCERAFVLH